MSDKIRHSTNKTRTIWSIINEAKNKTYKQINHPFSADDYNAFVTNIAKNESNNLSPLTMDLVEITDQYIQCPEIFFLQPIVETELDTIVRNLSNSSAKDIYGISNEAVKISQKRNHCTTYNHHKQMFSKGAISIEA